MGETHRAAGSVVAEAPLAERRGEGGDTHHAQTEFRLGPEDEVFSGGPGSAHLGNGPGGEDPYPVDVADQPGVEAGQGPGGGDAVGRGDFGGVEFAAVERPTTVGETAEGAAQEAVSYTHL